MGSGEREKGQGSTDLRSVQGVELGRAEPGLAGWPEGKSTQLSVAPPPFPLMSPFF